MGLTPSFRLGPYEILSPLGAGGMGKVYSARDTKLGRDVALKVLPEAFASNADRLARFQREAQVLASLNHPNIATIYGLEESDGSSALVMELVEGPTLAERIAGATVGAGLAPPRAPQGVPVQIDESLRIAKQIAEGLEYAHERGIIHRDLKPANVKVRPDGTVKILDFGLAKALEESPAAGSINTSPTISAAATQAGIILGTAAYMSPEQARGRAVDRRSDIWSFGAVLFEMLSGKQAFAGEDVSHTLAGVIMSEPDWSALPSNLPAPVGGLLRRCLTKELRNRLQAIGDARIVIEETLAGTPDVGAGLVPALGRPQASPRQFWRRALPWALAVVFLLGAVVSSVSYWRLARAPAPAIVSEIPPPDDSRFNYLGGPPVISPDGRTLAFRATDAAGNIMLWVRPLDSAAARPLPGTEGAFDPFWSADSRSLGFFADNKLKTIEVSGGSAVTVADAPDEKGGIWNRDEKILFVPEPAKGIYEVSASGGTPTPLVALDASKFWTYELGRFLPDGRHFLYTAELPGPAVAGTYFASLDGKEARLVLRDGGAVYASGYLLYVRDNALMAQAFDPEKGQLKGDPHRVAQNVGRYSLGFGLFDISENGIVIYKTGAATEKRLTWSDRAGKSLGVTGEVADHYDVRLSPGGEKLASNAGYPAGSPYSEIWVDELARGVRIRLTIDPATDHGIPVWSPDGSTIVFAGLHGKSRRGIYRKPSNGAGSEELLLPSENSDTQIWPTSWSGDGRFILYSRGGILGQAEIWLLPLAGDRKPRLFVHAPVAAYDGQFSPSGRWVAYTSRESGRDEIYVVPFDAARVLSAGSGPPGASASDKWLISASGGRCPRWRRDGKEIFYLSPDNQMMAAGVEERSNGIEVRRAQALFRAAVPPVAAISFAPYDVAPDGKKFIINTLSERNSPLTLVVNWTTNLKK